MRESLKAGLNFGMTSGVITTLGLMVGLHSGTRSALAVIGGILTIAVADSLSDAMGVHVSKEGEGGHRDREIWLATAATFVTKLVIAATFVVPLLLLELGPAILAGVAWGALLIGAMSWFVARSQGADPKGVILEHLLVGAAVVVATHYFGDWIGWYFREG